MDDKRAFDSLGGRFAAPVNFEQRVCVSIPVALIPYMLGALEPLRWPDVWTGNPVTINGATGEVENLFYRLVTRTRCDVPDCPDCGDTDAPPDSGGLGCAVVLEDTDMGQVVTDVTIANGHIFVWFGPCCSRDLGSIGALVEASTPADVNEPWEPTDPGQVGYSACSKAWGIVEAVYLIIQAAFDATSEFPWQQIGHIEDTVGYDLDNNWLYLLLGNVNIGAFIGKTYGDVYNQLEQQRIVARVVGLFADDAAGVATDSLFEQIKGSFKAEMYPLADYWQLFDQAINALGRHDMDTIAKMAAITSNKNCDAPTPPQYLFDGIGTGLDWLYIWDFRDGAPGWTLGSDNYIDAAKGLWSYSVNGVDNRCPVYAYIDFDQINNGSTLMLAGVVVEFLGDDNMDNNFVYFGHNNLTLVSATEIGAVTGDAPCTPGTHQIVNYGYDLMTTIDTRFRAYLYAYHEDTVEHPDTVQYSHRIVGVLFGGNGPGPLSNPPVYPPP